MKPSVTSDASENRALVVRLMAEVGEQLGTGPSDERRAALRARVLDESPAEGVHRVARPVWQWALAAGLVLAGTLMVWSLRRGEATLASGERIAEGAWVSAKQAPEVLRLKDGSRFVFEKGSDGRLARVGSQSVSVELATGKMDVEVTPDRTREVSVLAGPFQVAVVGTGFSVDWSPRDERFNVRVHHGVVRVTGRRIPTEGVLLRAGETLFYDGVGDAVSYGKGRVFADVAGGPGATLREPSGEELGKQAPATPEGAKGRSESAGAVLEPKGFTWQEVARSGNAKGAMETVASLGETRTLTAVGLADLQLLADTARLAGKASLAAEAYRTMRRRFAGSSEARTAAFVLGRLAADHGKMVDADQWFATYLKESPQGPLAMEAWGRRLVIASALPTSPQARQLSQGYLERYPHAPHSALARKLLGS